MEKKSVEACCAGCVLVAVYTGMKKRLRHAALHDCVFSSRQASAKVIELQVRRLGIG